MQEKYRDLADKVIASLNAVCVNRSPDNDDLWECAERLNCGYDWGATRGAFIFRQEKIVFKFPRFTSTRTDYCQIELENYNSAKEYGVERILLPVYHMGTTNHGIPVYLQPMFSYSEGDTSHKVRSQNRERVKQIHRSFIDKVRYNCYWAPPRPWTARAIQIYGKSFMRKFEKWTVARRINDLHSGNVGYLGRRPIIIDYAGFYE